MLHATRLRIPIVEVEGGSLTALAGFDGHQGVALVVEPRAVRDARRHPRPGRSSAASRRSSSCSTRSRIPRTSGTLLRSAEAAGVHGVIFPTRRQAPLTPAAVKASAGAVEHLLLCPVDDLAGALADLHGRGLRIVGAEADAPLTARQADLRGPLAIVVGSEGQGLGPAVRRRCDLFVRIPMRGAVGSLNAAVAGSILLFEAAAQRDPEGRARPRRRPPAAPKRAGPSRRLDAARTGSTETPSRPKPRHRADAPGEAAAPSRWTGAAGQLGPDRTPAAAGDDDASRRPSSQRRPSPARRRPRHRPTGDAAPPGSADARLVRRDRARRAPPTGPDAGPGSRRPDAPVATLDPSRRAGPIISRRRSGHLRYGPACRADVAQLVEQRFCKPPVPGSSPVVGSSASSSAAGPTTRPQSRSVAVAARG